MIVSYQKFKQKYGLLDEACRQWCAFAASDRSRMDGAGFGEFHEKLSLERYKEYRQNPDTFSITDKATEDVLLGLEIKFAVVNGETAMEGMSL